MEEKLTDQERARRDKLARYAELGVDPYGERFERTDSVKSAREKAAGKTGEELEANHIYVKLAGRIMALRKMGKAAFMNIKDVTGNIQCWLGINVLGEEMYNVFKLSDIGDIVGVEGRLMLSGTGELTIRVEKYTHLTKALRPLPEKFHGLTDVEERYRHRYVDLIMNDDSMKIALARPQIIRAIQEYCDSLGFHEVETSILSPILGGAAARPFVTHHNSLNKDFYLRIATEIALKKCIVGGMEKVYEIGRLFRNEGMDTKHNPEFTTVELYEAYGDMYTMMDIFEDILSGAANEILGTYEVEWQGEKINLSPGWKRMTMAEAVKEYVGIDFMNISDDAEAVQAAKNAGIDMDGKEPTWGNALYESFDQKVEEKLVQPTFITSHPVDVSPLAKKNPEDPRITERFELFICHSEMGNAFSELNDPIDQLERFQKQMEMREKGDEEAGMMDEDYINAMEYGMPPIGGLGIGIDRCVMLLSGCNSIRDVILFPTMKPIND